MSLPNRARRVVLRPGGVVPVTDWWSSADDVLRDLASERALAMSGDGRSLLWSARALDELSVRAAELCRSHVLEAVAEGVSWSEVGRMFGKRRQSVREKYGRGL